MRKNLVTITGGETRHKFLSSYLSRQENINILLSIQEKVKKLKDNKDLKKYSVFKCHIRNRKKTEEKYFRKFINKKRLYKTIKVEKGYLNKASTINLFKKLDPDLIITFGCSIIQEDFINAFKSKIINIHLGLSPYYRGSGTNFFPFVYKELQFLGSTIMKIDKGIDTGKIITQIRPKIKAKDNIHTIGNKIIFDTVEKIKEVVLSSKKIKTKPLKTKYKIRVLKNKDFTIDTLKKAYFNLKDGMIRKYLKNQKKLERKYKIVTQF